MSEFVYRPGPGERCSIGERELHCGDCFQLHWIGVTYDVRIELSDDWYLIGSPLSAREAHGATANFYAR